MECGIQEDVELIPESNQLLTLSAVAALALALALALAPALAHCTALVASPSATGLTTCQCKARYGMSLVTQLLGFQCRSRNESSGKYSNHHLQSGGAFDLCW
jgi:hypothetical protein